MKKQYSLLIIIALVLSSCHGRTVFSDFSEIEGLTWEKGEEYAFNVQIDDPAKVYELSLLIRNNDDFQKQNLWLCITREHNGQIEIDTVNIFLIDEMGKWRGSGLRNTYDNNLIWRANYHFPEAGSYVFRFLHLMRTDSLKGIERIGLEVMEKE